MKRTKYKTSTRIAKEQPPLSPEQERLDQRMLDDAGIGVTTRIEDNAHWLPEDLFWRPWIGAFDVIDTTKGLHKDPLLRLLRSEEPIRQDEREYLADLLEVFRFNDPVDTSSTSALKLLRESSELTRMQRLHLADLIERRTLKRPAHAPKTLAYQRTAVEARLGLDAEAVRQLMMHGGKLGGMPMDLETALLKIAPKSKDGEILREYITRQRSSTRRMETRRPKTPTP